MKQYIKLIIATSIPLVILWLPSSMFGLDNLTVVEHRVIALFFFAAVFWVLEPIPVYATSLLIIFIELIMISDKGLNVFIQGDKETIGTLLSYKAIMGTFASPIIILFLGGFFLAMAATKYRLDQNLSRVLLRPFGTNPKMVLLGLMLITAVFSMFMSNTATTAMMLSILAPVLTMFDPKDTGRIGFTLAIPFAANIGGIGTPIGTPPNAIALKYLTGADYISFGEWMVMAVPFVIVLLVIAWLLLTRSYPISLPKIELEIKGKFLKNRKARIVYFTFGLTILLWLTDFVHGMNAYVVALLPVAVFSATSIITKEDLKLISWDVLWLVSGGIALGLALEQSGLANHAIDSIPFGDFPVLIVLISASLLALIMANFMSHTATANLLLPLIAALGTTLQGIESIGGGQLLVLAVTFSCSIGMALPISTPPNALAYSTGAVETKNMARTGVVIETFGLVFIFILVYILNIIA